MTGYPPVYASDRATVRPRLSYCFIWSPWSRQA